MLWVLGCVLDYCIGRVGRRLARLRDWYVALFRDCCIDCWEVLCVLRDLRVEVLGGLRNGLKT